MFENEIRRALLELSLEHGNGEYYSCDEIFNYLTSYGRYDGWASFKPSLREVFNELEENLIYDFDKNHCLRLSNWYKSRHLLEYFEK